MDARPIHRLLVANRGEIARRVFATCRRLGIATVAVYSDADSDALFVGEADEAVALGGAAPADSYLRADALIAAARATGADAVHPGYGFLSENPAFAQAVLDAGLTWVGPSPAAIAAMGSKIEARDRMERAGVPVLPGRKLTPGDLDGDLDGLAAAIGFPLLVKASAGGGGKGMRLVESADGLRDGIDGARREAASAFGDDTLFLERFAPRSRHVEIQIVGDTRGRVVALYERDCSVQRRHQKIIEESPSPVVDERLRAAMSDAAIAAGETLAYVGAGTVEFLVTEEGEFYFLEVNTRLQVEHPVTEMVTGLDLVELQIRVAEGEAVPDPPPLRGHAIEARLYAEDARRDFLPVVGALTRFEIPEGVRVDTGVASGSQISPYYDPMIAKVIAHGATRADAARRLSGALARAHLHGTTTNRDFLVRVLRHPEFLAGGADTAFLDRHAPEALAAPLVQGEDARLAAAAAAMALQAAHRRDARVLASIPSGWRNVPSGMREVAFEDADGDSVAVGYRFDRSGGLLALRVDGQDLAGPELLACAAERVDLAVAGRRRRFSVHVSGQAVHVNTDVGQLSLRVLPRHPVRAEAAGSGSLASPMPGAVIRVMAEVGQGVAAGQPLLVLEAMKMEHEIVAPAAGVLAELRVEAGTQVQAGAILAVIEGAA
jgi:propionyl-CoA carboxylase alpha chain